MLANTREYLDVLERVKQDIARTQAKAALRASAELIRLYWRIGCEINARLDWVRHSSTLWRETYGRLILV